MYWDEILEIGGILLVIVAALLLLFGTIFLAAYQYDHWQCSGYEDATGRTTQFRAGNCYIETDAGWEIYAVYEARSYAENGLSK